MPVRRFDVGSWLDSPLSRRRLDLSQFVKERETVAEICSRVLADGDDALRELGLRYDGWAPAKGESFEVAHGDLAAASSRLPAADRAALEFAAQRIRDFHERQRQPASIGSPGLKLVTRPVRRAGVYAPGGRAAQGGAPPGFRRQRGLRSGRGARLQSRAARARGAHHTHEDGKHAPDTLNQKAFSTEEPLGSFER